MPLNGERGESGMSAIAFLLSRIDDLGADAQRCYPYVFAGEIACKRILAVPANRPLDAGARVSTRW